MNLAIHFCLLADSTADLAVTSHTGLSLFQMIFIPVCALLALRSVVRTWSGRTSRFVGLLGIGLWSAAAAAIAVPDATSRIAQRLGVHRGADLVVYLAILAGLAVCFYFYQRTRALENLVTNVVRQDAVRHAVRGGERPETPAAAQESF